MSMENGMFSINPKREGEKLTVTLKGEINIITSKEFEDYIDANLAGVSELIFDISEVEYVSSAGLRVFLISQKIMNEQGSMVILGMSEEIKDTFDITGFPQLMRIE